ncbi:MAG: ammonium transporter [Spirochaetia bacterium]|nr:ammonium transporter [Spirochaetia bacterium]
MKSLKKFTLITLFFLLPASLFAQEENPLEKISTDTAALTVAADTLWVLLCAILVFFMQAGFSLVEAGLNSAKNAVNVLFKNLMDFSVGAIAFFAVGFALMFGDGNDFIGLSGWFMAGADNSPAVEGYQGVYSSISWTGVPLLAKFFFQMVFAATAATIVSGAVAGRIKFTSYLAYSAVLTAVIYPISGHWVWGGGWLSSLGDGFHDFAGSIVVHAVGGFAGLAGAIILGPRIGKFSPDKKPQVMAGHNLPLAALGVFILWMGWYGFNPGSTMGIVGDNTALVNLIAANTTLAAAAGAITAMIGMWVLFGKPELSMALNGTLAGLVAITAPCDVVTPLESIFIGSIGGLLVIAGVKMLDFFGIDDPVGAWPVHGLNGIWGGLAAGIFGEGVGMMPQIVGSLVIPVYAFITMLVVFKVLDVVMKIRVTRDEELKGLDIGEHGEEAYNGFAIFTLD